MIEPKSWQGLPVTDLAPDSPAGATCEDKSLSRPPSRPGATFITKLHCDKAQWALFGGMLIICCPHCEPQFFGGADAA